jgi:hypothetical protein
MKKINIYLVLLVFVLTLGGCNEDEFLTADYYQGVVDVNFLTSPAHAKPAVTGVYDVMSYMGTSWDKFILGSSAADDIVEQHGDACWASLIAIDQYRWVPEEHGDPKHIWKYWQAYYAGIQRANLVLEKLPALEGMNEDLKKRYIAEVKALRAYFYYNLVIAFGDVPLILNTLGYEGAINITRSPQSEVWAQIIKDLTEAGKDLPDTYSDQSDKGRVTKGMTNALLDQVYLWQKDWAKAEAAAKKVIDSPAGYELEPNYADLFNGVSEYSKEAIFTAMRAAGSEKQNIWSDYMNETNMIIYWGPFASWSWFYQPDTNFVRHNTYIDPTDYRIDTMTYDVIYEKYDLNNNGDFTDDKVWHSPPGDIHMMKWVPVNVDLTDGSIWSGGLGYVDQFMIRLSEVYLDYAEALIRQGKDVNTAIEYINRVRRRANASDITTTNTQELLDIILNERKVEFCFEGKRFFDLKRVGRLKEFLGPLGWKDHMVNYPIPQEEIDLTQMTQNDGY